MISAHRATATDVVFTLMTDLKAGKRELIDVDDIIEALEDHRDAPARGTLAFEELLNLTLRKLAQAVA